MRDRLIELRRQAKKLMKNANNDIERDMIFADHLIANGVIAPPCKVGNTVYKVSCINCGAFCGIVQSDCNECFCQNREVIEGTVLAIKFVNSIRLKVRFDNIYVDYFSEDEVYFSKEEAEAALKERERG